MKSHKTDSKIWLKIEDAIRRWREVPLECDLAPYQPMLSCIRSISLSEKADKQLQEISGNLRKKAQASGINEELQATAYALVAEACLRVLRLSPFDNQILAGIAMHQGKLVELPTGEGKTLVAVFTAYLNSLNGQGVHVFTANDYLARRDAAWMGSVYAFLGLTVGIIQEGMNVVERQQAYGADITYVTAREAGFDFLRDHLAHERKGTVHRPFHLAIIDEADFILIDEARIPMVIAGPAQLPACDHHALARQVEALESGLDFAISENRRNVYLSERGIQRLETLLDCGNLFSESNRLLLTGINLALHARVLLHRDIDYIVRTGKIELVDEFTGRLAERRRWPDGIQPAVEAKENLVIQPQGRVLGSIALQHFVKLYPRLCGMTATAQAAADEFFKLYGLKTVVIPPHRPCVRIDHPDVVFADKQAKYLALTEEICRVHAGGQPILVGTATIRESEVIAGKLAEQGIACQVLNAKNDEKEAGIIAQAGALSAVTISTNMAGRGTDIRLGGAEGCDHAAVAARGGLYVIGCNRHESRRIDFQLRGRAGRQGDPGSSRFFVSLEDDLLVRYQATDQMTAQIKSQGNGRPYSATRMNREIAHLQRVVEGNNAAIRSTLRHYTALVEAQRQWISQWREDVLEGEADMIRHFTLEAIDHFWAEHLAVISDIRENIHLFRLAGKLPLEEFHNQIHREFSTQEKKIKAAIDMEVRKMKKSAAKQAAANRRKKPAATWVYLENDNPFSEFFSCLISSRNIGFQAAASSPVQLLFFLPLLLLLMLLKRIKQMLKRPK
ncbi:MAG: accessory Sec system translocase SecA2 [Candidatus Aminicenantes bacterium]|nr:accessory Sec system translocase SecA2 [Candidatus Aminicenantes bacterium]